MFFFNDTATTELYTYCHTLSLHDALPISLADDRVEHRPGPLQDLGLLHDLPHQQLVIGPHQQVLVVVDADRALDPPVRGVQSVRMVLPVEDHRSEEHTSELQSLMRISYAVFCLKQKKNTQNKQ